jgi:hypothetical protein
MHWILTTTLLLCGAIAEASPTALKPFRAERLQFRGEVAALLEQGDYARLESLAAELREKDPRFSSGISKLVDFYLALTPPHTTVKILERHFVQWSLQFPGSYLPKTGLSLLALSRAARARGGGWADTVTPSQWKEYGERLKEARWWATSALADDPRDPEFFCRLITLCRNESCPREAAEGWLARAVGLKPEYDSAYVEMANYLLPKWQGDPDAFTAFATAAADGNRALGDVVYTRVATVALVSDGRKDGSAVRRTYPRLDWGRIKAGLLELDRRFPDSVRTYHLLARFARVYEDRETARAALLRIGRDWGPDAEDYWFEESAFREAWEWVSPSRP